MTFILTTDEKVKQTRAIFMSYFLDIIEQKRKLIRKEYIWEIQITKNNGAIEILFINNKDIAVTPENKELIELANTLKSEAISLAISHGIDLTRLGCNIFRVR